MIASAIAATTIAKIELFLLSAIVVAAIRAAIAGEWFPL